MKKLKGSAVLVVVLSAIVFSIYATSTYAEVEHFNVIQKQYEESIVEYYENGNEDIEEIYQELYKINKYNDSKYIGG